MRQIIGEFDPWEDNLIGQIVRTEESANRAKWKKENMQILNNKDAVPCRPLQNGASCHCTHTRVFVGEFWKMVLI